MRENRKRKKERKRTTQGRDGRTARRHHTGILRRGVWGDDTALAACTSILYRVCYDPPPNEGGAPELVAPHPSNTGVFDACSTLSPRVRRGCWTARGACPPRRPRLRGWLPTKPWAPDHRPPRRQRRQQPQLLCMCRTPGAACPMARRRCRRQSTGSLALARGVPLSR